MLRRRLGKSGIEVSALGLGGWAAGGPAWRGGKPIGWGEVDDERTIRALRLGLDLGVNLVDTADVYGCGRGEEVVGRAIAGRRDKVVLATKFGYPFAAGTGQALVPGRVTAQYVREACAASLRRLGTDFIDLYQFHLGRYEEDAGEIRDALEGLAAEGKIRWYGWSTDDPARAEFFAGGSRCAAVQLRLNVFEGSRETLAAAERLGLAALCRSPLAMGILTGKFNPETRFAADDVRSGWDMRAGPAAERLRQLAAVRDLLASGGRTPAQGALSWLWALSPAAIPIPGFKTEEQVRENAGALACGPLAPEVMAGIERALGRGGKT